MDSKLTTATAKASFLDEMKETMEAFTSDLWDHLVSRGELDRQMLHREDGAIDPKLGKSLVALVGQGLLRKWEDEIETAATPEHSGGRCGIRGPLPHDKSRCTVESHHIENYNFHEDAETNEWILQIYKGDCDDY